MKIEEEAKKNLRIKFFSWNIEPPFRIIARFSYDGILNKKYRCFFFSYLLRIN